MVNNLNDKLCVTSQKDKRLVYRLVKQYNYYYY